jgi:hypothetical protein
VQTFQPQRFIVRQRNYFAFSLAGDRNSVHPIDSVLIQHQFAIALRIVEHSHFTVPDDDKLLFLERMQPTYENVGFDTAQKTKNR